MKQIEKAAQQRGKAKTNCLSTGEADSIDPLPGPATQFERVAIHLLENGQDGISALSALWCLDGLNLHESISKLRRHHGITIKDTFFVSRYFWGGQSYFKRYWLANRSQAWKVAKLVNQKRRQRGAALLSLEECTHYFALYSPTFPPNR